MGTPITDIRNLGPAMANAFAAVGITSAEQLRDLGTDAAYGRLLENGTRPHFITYYVIEMGLQGRPWNDCKGAEKAALRIRFDALKSRHVDTDLSAFEAVLNQIGVIAPQGRSSKP